MPQTQFRISLFLGFGGVDPTIGQTDILTNVYMWLSRVILIRMWLFYIPISRFLATQFKIFICLRNKSHLNILKLSVKNSHLNTHLCVLTDGRRTTGDGLSWPGAPGEQINDNTPPLSCREQITVLKIDKICPLAIPNQISTISMHISCLVKIHWDLLEQLSRNEKLMFRRQITLWKLDENFPLAIQNQISTIPMRILSVIVQKWNYGRATGRWLGQKLTIFAR